MEVRSIIIAVFSLFFTMSAIAPHPVLADELTSEIESPNAKKKALTPQEIDPTISESPKKNFKSKLRDEEDFKKMIMEKIPYAKQAKYMWDVVDGDVDIYMKNLRADRKNKGLSYTTNRLPLIGEVKNVEFKFNAGEDMGMSFETNRMPFVGTLEGFKLKGTMGEDSRISARYTIPLDF